MQLMILMVINQFGVFIDLCLNSDRYINVLKNLMK